MKPRFIFVFTLLFVSALGAFAQGKPSPAVPLSSQPGDLTSTPVVVQRTAPPGAAGAKLLVPPPDKYPFAQIMQELQKQRAGDSRASDSIGLKALGATPLTPVSTTADDGEVPGTFVERQDVQLTPTAMDAVALNNQIVSERNTPAPSPDGKVVYIYGIGMPTVVCAPLRVCSLELQAGEKMAGEPQIGDSVRWIVTPATAGSGDFATPVLVIKPKLPGLDTTMIVTTDKRTYYVRLVSKAQQYVARTAFAYSDDEHVQWKAFLEEQEKEKQDRLVASRVSPTATDAIDKIYFDYEVKVGKGAVGIRPDRVMDDGEKTYIQMPETAMHRELPALVIHGPTGNEMVNYRVKGNTYVVDRLFDRAALLMGSGKHQEKVELVRKESLTPEAK